MCEALKNILLALTVTVTAITAGTCMSAKAEGWSYGLNGSKGFNEKTYATIDRQLSGGSSNNWRDGSMTGNGEMGMIDSCNPSEDVIIYNNTKFVLGTNDIFDVADVSENLDSIRKTAADRTNPGQWQGWVKNYWKDNYGADSHLSSNTKMYHPAAQLRIKNNVYTQHDDYNRYTNFESGEIGSQWKSGSDEYNTRSFVSRADGVAVTVIQAANGKELNLTLSIDNLLEMGIDSTAMANKGVEICPESKEIVKSDKNGYYLGQFVKYGDFNIKGSDTNPDAYGAKGGYATAIRMICGDNAKIEETVDEHTITPNERFNTVSSKDISTPKITVSGTDSIILVSKADMSLSGFTDVNSVEALCNSLLSEIDEKVASRATGVEVADGVAKAQIVNRENKDKEYMLVSAEYNSDGVLTNVNTDKKVIAPGESGELSVIDLGGSTFLWDENQSPYTGNIEPIALYENMLSPHEKIHKDMFDGTELELCSTEDEKADRELTNTELNAKQQADSNINKAWLERLYQNGRFGLICSSGYNTTRLGGIWVGNWMPDWSGDFTQDANVNLQVSAVNTTGLKDTSQSYMTYILRQVSDWQTNAKRVYGITDGIMAGPRTDGDGNGTIYHTLAGYPFLYWNTGADWLIVPIYEYYQCYGNEKIPVGEDVSLDELTDVLDLSEADKARISSEGFDLENDILAPLVTKLYNFWQGYTDERFYISADGTEMHLNDGTTMGENDRYMFSPGYSPENVPSADGTGYNGSPSLAANTTMDISAAHDSMTMMKGLINSGVIKEKSVDEVNSFEAKFPEYLYGEDGALKEWAVSSYEEHYNHRHVSHTYSAWPGYEAKSNNGLTDALATALDMRYTYNVNDNAQAHGHLHDALVEARIKRSAEYENQLHTLIASNYEYQALMTSHNMKHASAFCTDNAFGLTGVVTEGLLYSDTGVVELLPSLVDSFESGKITNLMSRSNASIDVIEWNGDNVNSVITSNKDNNKIKLMCGLAWDNVLVNNNIAQTEIDENNNKCVYITLNKGESVSVLFEMNSVANGTYYLKTINGYLGVESYAEGAKTVETEKPEKWNINYNTDGTYTIVNTYSGRVLNEDNIVRNSDYTWKSLDGFTLERQKNQTVGSCADEIVITTSSDISEELSAGKTVKFSVSKITPGTAISKGYVWEVKAEDGTKLTSTSMNGDVLIIGTDAVGKKLNITAKSPDGSCVSNMITVSVASVQTKTIKTEMEYYSYGFGNFKNEGSNIGTINGRAVIKFSDVDFNSLISAYFFKSNTKPGKTTLYYDLEEASEKEYYDDYSRDSGTGKGEASKRYIVENVTIDETKRISDTIANADGTSDVNMGVSGAPNGVHDLYVVIDSNGQTWSGNYDYMELTYTVGTYTEKIECENLTYGFGNFKNETSNVGTINNTAVLKYSNINFDELSSINTVMLNSNYSAYIQFYRDLEESEEKTLFTYDKDTTQRDYRYKIEDVTIDEGKSISDKVSICGSIPVEVNAGTGIGNLYMVIRKVSGTWAGNFDYLELNYLTSNQLPTE